MEGNKEEERCSSDLETREGPGGEKGE